MQYGKTLMAAGALLSLTALNSQASLSLTDNGLGVYDSGINATWTQDANLLGTLEAGNSSLIATIVSDEATAIYTAYGHGLSASDFGAGGTANWFGAEAYVDYLNTIDYGNSNQWALPTSNAVAGYNNGSALGELFYTELGGKANSSMPSGPFSNVQAIEYWTGTEYASSPNSAWYFYNGTGYQYHYYQNLQFYAWAVSPGQVSAVPEPGAIWLVGIGMLGLLGLKRRGHAG